MLIAVTKGVLVRSSTRKHLLWVYGFSTLVQEDLPGKCVSHLLHVSIPSLANKASLVQIVDSSILRITQVTIIERSWAKYSDVSVASRSIISRSRRLRQIIDLRDTDKSRYFALTDINNCFIIRSPFFWSTKMSNPSLPARGTDPPFSHKSAVSITHEQNYLRQHTYL